MSQRIITAIVIAVCGLIGQTCHAEDAAATAASTPVGASDQALKDAQNEVAMAKARLDLATEENDLLKLQAGSIDTSNLPKGTATVAGMDLEGQLRAYAASAQSIDFIVNEVSSALGDDKRVVLATDTQLQAINQYRAFVGQMAVIKKQGQQLLDKQPKINVPKNCPKPPQFSTDAVTPVAAATVIVNSLLGVVALFKTDVDIKGSAVTLSDFAISSMLLKSMRANSVTPIYPPAFYVLPPSNAAGKAATAFNDVMDLKAKLQKIAEKSTADLAAAQAAHAKAADCKDALAAAKQGVDEFSMGQTVVSKSIDDVAASLTKQDAQSGLTLLNSYLVSERIDEVINAEGKKAKILFVKAIAAGGSTQTRKNLFYTSISYGGGSILSYQLFSQDGDVLLANTVPWYAGSLNAKDLAPGQVVLDNSDKKKDNDKDKNKDKDKK